MSFRVERLKDGRLVQCIAANEKRLLWTTCCQLCGSGCWMMHKPGCPTETEPLVATIRQTRFAYNHEGFERFMDQVQKEKERDPR